MPKILKIFSGKKNDSVRITGIDSYQFGKSVCLSMDRAIIGAYKKNNNGDNVGTIYIIFCGGISISGKKSLNLVRIS